MNRGTLPGIARAIGDYVGGTASQGSWGGNRGRIHSDEFRAFGNADGQRNWLPVTGGRLINTNNQAGVGSLFLPGDMGMIYNGLSGTIVCAGVPPFAAVYNTGGRLRFSQSFASATVMFEVNTIVDNLPGVAVTLPTVGGLDSTVFYIANGAAVTQTPGNDIVSRPFIGSFNSGTLTCSGTMTGFRAAFTSGVGSTLTNRVGYGVDDITAGSALTGVVTGGAGTVTNQYGVDIPILTGGGTLNTAIRIGQGGQTLTSLVASNGQIDFYTGTTTLNVASGALPAAINMSGTIALTLSAQALGMLACFTVKPTVTNTVGSTVSMGPVLGLVVQPTITANTQTLTGSTVYGMLYGPTLSVLAGGTLSAMTLIGAQAGGATIGTGTTVTTYTAFNVVAPTVSGTLTTFVGVDIAAVTSGGTNFGIRNKSSLAQQGAFIGTNNTVTVTTNAGTVASTAYMSTFTNSSAATMTITMSTTGATDGQQSIVRVYDFSAVAETISWVNTENSTATVPTTSNGSTTSPKIVTFMFNSATTKWRCIESV